jgi:hypothetical protein
MAGLVPAIHVFAAASFEDVDAWHKAEHDDEAATLAAEYVKLEPIALLGFARHAGIQLQVQLLGVRQDVGNPREQAGDLVLDLLQQRRMGRFAGGFRCRGGRDSGFGNRLGFLWRFWS